MPTKQQLRAEYVARINRALDHVQAHLTEALSLEKLAKVASFSPYHFHRIFHAMVGEPLGQYVQRLRIERAAVRLVQEPNAAVTQIALECGYGSSAAFSRAFRDVLRMTPSQWRQDGHSKICMSDGKYGMPLGKLAKETEVEWVHHGLDNNPPLWRIMMPTNNAQSSKLTATVEVKDLPDMEVAYLRHIGPYAGQGELFGTLFGNLAKWAGARGLLGPNTQALSVYYDDPSLTEESKLRLDCCFTVPTEAKAEGEVGRNRLPGGRYAVARFEIAQERYGEAWSAVMGGWLPESGYQPDDRPCYEIYKNDPKEHPEHKQIVDICVPVKPL